MKVNLDETIMQSKTMARVCKIMNMLLSETKRLAKPFEFDNEHTKEVIADASYIIGKHLKDARNHQKRKTI
jgi:hypothetical protein|tara:strand:+ start:460 stop:672 length:213 start_codon:yes stop_codon:yes gene_type:complete